MISDLHAPFHHPHALDFLRDIGRELKPDSVICSGDEVDCHNFARWPRAADAVGPNEEVEGARQTLRALSKIYPRLTVVESNHTWRPWRRAAVAGLLPSMMRSRQQVFDTPADWLWVQAACVDGVTFIHGEGFAGDRAAIDAAKTYHRNVVIGHVHSHAGIKYASGPTSQIFGMNVGCLIDPSSPAFDYGRTYRHKPVLGCGIVVDGVPAFVPLFRDSVC